MNRVLVVITDGVSTFVYSRPNRMLYFIHYSKVDSEPKREWLLVGRELCNVEEALNHLEKAGLPCKLHVD